MFPLVVRHYNYHGYNFIPSPSGVSIPPAPGSIYDIINNTLLVLYILCQQHLRHFQYNERFLLQYLSLVLCFHLNHPLPFSTNISSYHKNAHSIFSFPVALCFIALSFNCGSCNNIPLIIWCRRRLKKYKKNALVVESKIMSF